MFVALDDGPVDAGGKSKIIGIDNESSHPESVAAKTQRSSGSGACVLYPSV